MNPDTHGSGTGRLRRRLVHRGFAIRVHLCSSVVQSSGFAAPSRCHSARTCGSDSASNQRSRSAANAAGSSSSPSAHTAAPRRTGEGSASICSIASVVSVLASASDRSDWSYGTYFCWPSGCDPLLPSAISTLRKKRTRPLRLIGDLRKKARNAASSISRKGSRRGAVRSSRAMKASSAVCLAKRFHGQTARQSSQP